MKKSSIEMTSKGVPKNMKYRRSQEKTTSQPVDLSSSQENITRRTEDQNAPPSDISEQPDGEPETRSNAESQTAGTHAPPNAEDVPVPSDDELLCIQEEQCWQLSFELTDQEISQLAGTQDTEECIALLVTNAKKQKTITYLSPADKQRFTEAKDKEIKSWLEAKTLAKIARNRIAAENIMKCRWLLTWKDGETNQHLSAGTSNTNRKPKARLVALGYQDPLLHDIQRDSPTLTKLGRSLILQLASSGAWRISSFDVKTAFLRGAADQNRILAVEPVPEFRHKLKMHQGEVLQCSSS